MTSWSVATILLPLLAVDLLLTVDCDHVLGVAAVWQAGALVHQAGVEALMVHVVVVAFDSVA